MLKVGFSGTREGMTVAQRHAFKELINQKTVRLGTIEFHHGDCVGADLEAHIIVNDELKYDRHKKGHEIIVHPPIEDKFRAFSHLRENDLPVRVLIEEGYHKRNDEIIRVVDELIATPSTFHSELRSGTWSVIRKCEKIAKELTIIRPDGSLITNYR